MPDRGHGRARAKQIEMHKSTPFPTIIQPGSNLNDTPPPDTPTADQPTEGKPKATTVKPKKPLIDEIGDYLTASHELRYNQVKNEIEFKRKNASTWQDCDERAALRFEAELLRAGHKGVSRTLNVYLANVPEFDPIAGYLDALPAWDGKDHISELAGYVDISQNRREWFNLMFKKHLVRMLACATGKSDFNKQIFVFVSGQNDGKTTFTRFLCPPAWKAYYSEEIDFENKDGLIALARNVIINLDELRGMSRSDITKIKSYTSKDNVKARLPFDRRETRLRRVASFFASTNNAEFLTDETGNVRWLVFEIKGINHDNGGANGYGQNIDIDKIYSQARHLMSDPDFKSSLTREEIQKSESFNQGHTVKSAEFEAIQKHFEPDKKGVFMQPLDIQKRLNTGFFYDFKHLVPIGKSLAQLRFDRIKKRHNGQSVYGYMVRELLPGEWEAGLTDSDED